MVAGRRLKLPKVGPAFDAASLSAVAMAQLDQERSLLLAVEPALEVAIHR